MPNARLAAVAPPGEPPDARITGEKLGNVSLVTIYIYSCGSDSFFTGALSTSNVGRGYRTAGPYLTKRSRSTTPESLSEQDMPTD